MSTFNFTRRPVGQRIVDIPDLLTGLGNLASYAQKSIRDAIDDGKPITIIPFGDSITQSGSSGSVQLSNGFSTAAPMLTERAMRVIRNAGITGNTTGAMLARIQADVIAHKPDVCILMGGTNDAANGLTNAQIAATMDNLEAMVKQLLDAGILPVLVTPPPRNGGTQSTAMKNLQFFHYMLAQHYGLPLFDFYRLLVDPTNGALQAIYNSGDGTHPNALAHQVGAAQLAILLDDLGDAFCGPYLASVAETAGNQLANSVYNGNCALAAVANVPDGWQTLGNGTVELVDVEYPYTGKGLQYTRSTGTDASGPTAYGPNLSGGGFEAGDVLELNLGLEVSGLPATPEGFQFYLLTQGGNPGSLAPYYFWKANGVYETNFQFTVPPGTTNINIANFIRDAATYTYRNVTIVNRSRHERIWKPG